MMNDRHFLSGAVGRVATETGDDRVVVRILGEVDLSNYEAIGDELAKVSPGSQSRVIVDLTETDYLDSSGVGLLFDLISRLRGVASVALVAPERCPAGRVIRHVGIEQLVPVFESTEQADAAFS